MPSASYLRTYGWHLDADGARIKEIVCCTASQIVVTYSKRFKWLQWIFFISSRIVRIVTDYLVEPIDTFRWNEFVLSLFSAKEDINYVYWLFGVGVGVGEVFRSAFRYMRKSKIVSTNSKGNKIIFILFLISVSKSDFVFVSNEMGLHLGFNWCYFIISNIRLTSPEPARR